MNDKQHQEDTKYLQWADGMYVMLKDLLCDYEAALVENSLRGSVYFHSIGEIREEDSLGVFARDADYWFFNRRQGEIKLTRAQALYIATGDTTCITY
jgi:hypothetical protein